MTPQIAVLMADYNRWMNGQLYDAAGTLAPEEVVRERGAFFGSLLGTLNHLVVADTIWLQRFARHQGGFAALAPLASVPTPASLRQPMAYELGALRGQRARLDDLIVAWAAELTPERLAGDFTYTSTVGVASRRSFAALVQHFFNHQTHHRGQATTLLSQAGVDVGVTDLLARIANEDA